MESEHTHPGEEVVDDKALQMNHSWGYQEPNQSVEREGESWFCGLDYRWKIRQNYSRTYDVKLHDSQSQQLFGYEII